MEHPFTNKLIGETSPYLLQHAHNPVNWYPWGEEALALARDEDKPILVSIGYAACHWCHVMERESFEDEQTAALMNNLFINIKIDREERPDLDHIFMDAVQAMHGSGGWPLNVFLTPGGKPFYGGTYFPPVKAFNRPSWREVLAGVSRAFKEKRPEIETQADQLTDHMIQANAFGGTPAEGDHDLLSENSVREIAAQIMVSADRQWGGFGQAPKFPQTFAIQYLLRFAYAAEGATPENIQEKQRDSIHLEQAILSLDKMIQGGIYDHIGGGFARYATDTEWLVPHFEKMLYDNALLVSVFSEAYQLTRYSRYQDVIDDTIRFVQRELMHPEGGFYSAIDADSEGEEGRFYVWNYGEVMAILGNEGELFCDFYDIKPGGNWHEGRSSEKKSIPWIKTKAEEFCRDRKMDPEQFRKIMTACRAKLFTEREKRVRPLTDDKIILGWNALMNLALSKAYAATGNTAYRKLAEGNMKFLLGQLAGEGSAYFHTWKNGQKKHPAFLDDLAYLVQALIRLQEVTGEFSYLVRAKEITDHIIGNYQDRTGPLFYFTGIEQNDVLVRKKEIYDGAQPSGNSVMAENLFRLSVCFDRPDWKEHAFRMLHSVQKATLRYPVSFGNWSCFLLLVFKGADEIVILGEDYKRLLEELLAVYLPHALVMANKVENEMFPLLMNKMLKSGTAIYLCKDYACRKPVFTIGNLLSEIGHK